jgi:hypothetical protein
MFQVPDCSFKLICKGTYFVAANFQHIQKQEMNSEKRIETS